MMVLTLLLLLRLYGFTALQTCGPTQSARPGHGVCCWGQLLRARAAWRGRHVGAHPVRPSRRALRWWKGCPCLRGMRCRTMRTWPFGLQECIRLGHDAWCCCRRRGASTIATCDGPSPMDCKCGGAEALGAEACNARWSAALRGTRQHISALSLWRRRHSFLQPASSLLTPPHLASMDVGGRPVGLPEATGPTKRPRVLKRNKEGSRTLRATSTQSYPPQDLSNKEGPTCAAPVETEAEPGPVFPVRQVCFVLSSARIGRELLRDAELIHAMRCKGSRRAALRLARHATPAMISARDEKAECPVGSEAPYPKECRTRMRPGNWGNSTNDTKTASATS